MSFCFVSSSRKYRDLEEEHEIALGMTSNERRTTLFLIHVLTIAHYGAQVLVQYVRKPVL